LRRGSTLPRMVCAWVFVSPNRGWNGA
jgi:hypothetical protein